MIYATDPITTAIETCEEVYPNVDAIVDIDATMRVKRFLGFSFGKRVKISVYADAPPTIQISADLTTVEAAIAILHSVTEIVCMHCSDETKDKVFGELTDVFVEKMVGTYTDMYHE